MSEKQYELAYDSWGAEEQEAIARVFKKGRFTMGEEVAEFEKEFAAHFGVKHAVMVSSGSMANLIAVGALFHKKENPLQRGDEVIVPAVAWATTYYPLHQYGLKLKIMDVDLDTLNMDMSHLEEAITEKTKMIVGVSILGNPAELTKMRELCDRRGLYFFEDNCESMGASVDGKWCGTFGDVCTFSTFFSHHISTMEGGLILTDDLELAHLAICLRAHGWSRNLPAESPIFERSTDDFYEAYRFLYPGYNGRPLELSGAIGREQLKKLDQFVEVRRKNAALFVDLFKDDKRFIIQKENGVSSWFSFTLIVRPGANLDRANVMKALSAAGIDYRIITGGNVLQHDVIKHFDYETPFEVKNAYTVHDHGLFVGNAPIDMTDQIYRLRNAIDTGLGIDLPVASKNVVEGVESTLH